MVFRADKDAEFKVGKLDGKDEAKLYYERGKDGLGGAECVITRHHCMSSSMTKEAYWHVIRKAFLTGSTYSAGSAGSRNQAQKPAWMILYNCFSELNKNTFNYVQRLGSRRFVTHE